MYGKEVLTRDAEVDFSWLTGPDNLGNEDDCIEPHRAPPEESFRRSNGTRIIYPKEFLIFCSRNPASKKKPANLPENLEVTLNEPRINGLDPYTNLPGSNFFRNQNSQRFQGGHNSQGGQGTYRGRNHHGHGINHQSHNNQPVLGLYGGHSISPGTGHSFYESPNNHPGPGPRFYGSHNNLPGQGIYQSHKNPPSQTFCQGPSNPYRQGMYQNSHSIQQGQRIYGGHNQPMPGIYQSQSEHVGQRFYGNDNSHAMHGIYHTRNSQPEQSYYQNPQSSSQQELVKNLGEGLRKILLIGEESRQKSSNLNY